jgi:RimJ/RimL family protein N-acetyltransferase
VTDLRSDLAIRPLAGVEELGLFCKLSYTLDEELADDLAGGRRRPEWMWVALRGDRLVARAAFWGQRDNVSPFLLDFLDVADDADRVEVGAQLLRVALGAVFPDGSRPSEYLRYIPPDWREHDDSRRVVEDRMEIVGQTGAQLFVERLRFEWRPLTPVAVPTDRVAFRPIADDGELIDLMTQVMSGTLDAHSRDDLSRMSAREGAIRHFDEELAQYESPREWWRIATLPDGEPVGFVIPGANNYGVIIGYLGVVPSHRGHGYIDEILAEGTRVLAAQSPPRIRASTDLANTPMAEAFSRAGYVNFERAINMTWK